MKKLNKTIRLCIKHDPYRMLVIFFIYILVLFNYSWLTMLCSFQVYSKMILTYIYMYSLLDSFLIWVIIEYWLEFLVLYSRSLLVIYLIYGSVCMFIPSFWFIPHPFFPSYLKVCFCFVIKFIYIFFKNQIPCMSDIIFVFLSDILHVVW